MSSWCVAPAKVAQVVPRAVLRSLIVFLIPVAVYPPNLPAGFPPIAVPWNTTNPYSEHATRALIVDGEKWEPPAGDKQNGALLFEGYGQAGNLAQKYGVYINKTGVGPTSYQPSRFRVYSADYPVALQTANLFLGGLYPLEVGEAVPEDAKEVRIGTGKDDGQPFACPFCKDHVLGKNISEALKSPEARKRIKEARKLSRRILRGKVAKRLTDWEVLNIGDRYLPYYCASDKLPKTLTKDEFRKFLSNRAFVERSYAQYSPNTSINPINDFVLREIGLHLSGEDVPHFTVASAAGPAVVALLLGLNYTGLDAPLPTASHLAIEVWDNGSNYARVVLNGEVVPINGESLVALEEFQAILDRSGSVEIALAKLRSDVRRLQAEVEVLRQQTEKVIEGLGKTAETDSSQD